MGGRSEKIKYISDDTLKKINQLNATVNYLLRLPKTLKVLKKLTRLALFIL